MTAVHQFVPSLAGRDAIGAHALGIQRLLRAAGYASDFYVETSDLGPRPDVHPYQRFAEVRSDEPTFLLYQASTGSKMARFLLERSEPVLVNYHNVTPPGFFEPWEPSVATVLTTGLRQIEDLASRTRLAIADSPFNEQELLHFGYRDTTVVPILFDPEAFAVDPDPVWADRFTTERASGGTEWLFVGRIAPNKAQHDIVKAFAAYRTAYEPRARLRFVGGSSSHLYQTAIEAFVREIGCEGVITFEGSVSTAQLVACFRNADVFVCLSRHEGFCVPLLEAMHFGVPIVALRSTAVPDTLAGAGIVVPNATPAVVAAAVDRVAGDAELRDGLVARGRARVQELASASNGERLVEAVRAVCGDP